MGILQSSHKGTSVRAGDVVYLRCRVVGFDADERTHGFPVILQPIDKAGNDADPAWHYATIVAPVPGGATVEELKQWATNRAASNS